MNHSIPDESMNPAHHCDEGEGGKRGVWVAREKQNTSKLSEKKRKKDPWKVRPPSSQT